MKIERYKNIDNIIFCFLYLISIGTKYKRSAQVFLTVNKSTVLILTFSLFLLLKGHDLKSAVFTLFVHQLLVPFY